MRALTTLFLRRGKSINIPERPLERVVEHDDDDEETGETKKGQS
jgi:hypothetical protein